MTRSGQWSSLGAPLPYSTSSNWPWESPPCPEGLSGNVVHCYFYPLDGTEGLWPELTLNLLLPYNLIIHYRFLRDKKQTNKQTKKHLIFFFSLIVLKRMRLLIMNIRDRSHFENPPAVPTGWRWWYYWIVGDWLENRNAEKNVPDTKKNNDKVVVLPESPLISLRATTLFVTIPSTCFH